MSQNNVEKTYLIQSLQWHLDNGADETISDVPVDRTVSKPTAPVLPPVTVTAGEKTNVSRIQKTSPSQIVMQTEEIMGAAQAVIESQKLAASCTTLEQLANAIKQFNGLSIKNNATNMVFSDGNPKAEIMLIGEAPGADEDIQGKPFVGLSGQLLDRILSCINLERNSDNPKRAVYISNILNWRPPGNRTPTQAEIDISLPFIERHIALIQPRLILFCGGVSAKGLLRSTESITKLRNRFHDYKVPELLQISEMKPIPALATYHPAYLLRTPSQKRAVWADMLAVQEKMAEIQQEQA